LKSVLNICYQYVIFANFINKTWSGKDAFAPSSYSGAAIAYCFL